MRGGRGEHFRKKTDLYFCVCVRVCACVHISVRPIGTATFNALDGNI